MLNADPSAPKDAKLAGLCVAYIRRAAMNPESWIHTRLAEIDPQMTEVPNLEHGELPIVASYLSPVSWSVFTSRRVFGTYFGRRVDVATDTVTAVGFGNFKGHGGKAIEVLTLNCGDAREMRLEYETGAAAMAAMHYFEFWKRKVPTLDILVG